MKYFFLAITLCLSSCASRSKLDLRAPTNIPRPEKTKSTDRAIQGLNNMSRYINSADSRVDRIKELLVELEAGD